MWRSVAAPELAGWLRDNRRPTGYPLAEYGEAVDRVARRCLAGSGWVPGRALTAREQAILDGVAVAAAECVRGLVSTRDQVLSGEVRAIAARYRRPSP